MVVATRACFAYENNIGSQMRTASNVDHILANLSAT
jgi:hypothetical protein